MNLKIKSNNELLELFEDKDKFNSFIQKVIEVTKQQTLLLIPEIVIKHIQDQHKYKKLVDQFYSNNPELVKEKPLIGQLINKLASDQPELSIEELFKKTAIQAKKVLGERNETSI